MNKLLGLNRLWIFWAAALFCLTFAAPKSSAQNIVIGAGVDDPCYDGSATIPKPPPPGSGTVSNGGSWCGILSPEVNVVLDNSFNWYQNTDQNSDIVSNLILIFAVPVQNLLKPFEDLFGPQLIDNPILTSSPFVDKDGNPWDHGEFVSHTDLPCWFGCPGVLDEDPLVDVDYDYLAKFKESYTAPPFSTAFDVPEGWGGLGFTQGTEFKLGAMGADGITPAVGNTDIYDWLGLPYSGPKSNSITNWTNATVEIPSIVLGGPATSPPFVTPDKGWKIYMVSVDEKDLVGAKDAIQFYFDETKLPLGTWVAAWAVGATKCTKEEGGLIIPIEGCDPNYFSMAFTESAFLMPLPSVPEPTSLLLLGVGLAMVAGFNRKRGGKRN